MELAGLPIKALKIEMTINNYVYLGVIVTTATIPVPILNLFQ